MARPRRAPGEALTEDRLLDAAEIVFGRSGFALARLEEIADLVGIRRPSLLYHFGTKEELYRAVLARGFGALGQVLERALAEPAADLSARASRVALDFAAFVSARPDVARLVVRELADAGQAEPASPGGALLLEFIDPILGRLEAFLGTDGDGPPVREVMLLLATSVLVRTAAGPVGRQLFGAEDHLPELAAKLFADRPQPPTEDARRARPKKKR